MKKRATVGVAPWLFETPTGSDRVPSFDDSLPPTGPHLSRALELLVATLNESGVKYAIIGGVAVLQHTRVRTTDDIDVLLSIPQLQMASLFESLANRGFTIDLLSNIRGLRDHGITSLRYQDVAVDLLAPVLPVYAHVLDRAQMSDINGQPVKFASAEGLIVIKLIAMRPQDESDIRELLAAYAGKLDLDFIRREMEAFADPNDLRRSRFEQWVRDVSGG